MNLKESTSKGERRLKAVTPLIQRLYRWAHPESSMTANEASERAYRFLDQDPDAIYRTRLHVGKIGMDLLDELGIQAYRLNWAETWGIPQRDFPRILQTAVKESGPTTFNERTATLLGVGIEKLEKDLESLRWGYFGSNDQVSAAYLASNGGAVSELLLLSSSVSAIALTGLEETNKLELRNVHIHTATSKVGLKPVEQRRRDALGSLDLMLEELQIDPQGDRRGNPAYGMQQTFFDHYHDIPKNPDVPALLRRLLVIPELSPEEEVIPITRPTVPRRPIRGLS